MPRFRPRRGTLLALCALAGLLGVGAAPPAGAPPPMHPPKVVQAESLVGQCLVATESLQGPSFARTVVYVIRHDAGGAMGLIVNRPVQDLPLASLLRTFGRDDRGVTGSVRAHFGGPVETRLGFVLHTGEYATAFTERIAEDISVTPQEGVPALLDDVAHGGGPRKSLFALGYSGWAPGQLEREIAQGSWITVPADEALLFDEDHARKWERATARRLTI
jgi:putative transcriptional regulator